ncbi:hypothetical protein APSETT445_008813 [Aspergillus pseudonomiae]
MAGNLEFNEHGKLCIVVSPGSQVKLNIRRFESKEQKSLSALVQDSFSPDNVDFTEFLPEEPTAPKQLKARCTPHLTEVDYITSYDCISALTWTSITRARLNLHPEKSSSPSRFVHPIDVRTRDPEKKTSERYFGNAVVGSQAGPITAEALVSDGDRGIAAAATLIRQSINSTSLSTISHMTSLMKSLTPAETLGSRADFNDVDVFMNTWYSGNAESTY